MAAPTQWVAVSFCGGMAGAAGRHFTDCGRHPIPQKLVIDPIAHWFKDDERSRVGGVILASRLPTSNLRLSFHPQICMNQIENWPVNEWNHYDPSDRLESKDSWNPVLTEKPLIMNGFSIDSNTNIANVDRAIDGEPMIKEFQVS